MSIPLIPGIPAMPDSLAGAGVRGIEIPLSSWPCGWDSSIGAAAAGAGTGAAGAGAESPLTLVDEDMPLEDEEIPPKSIPSAPGAVAGDGDIGGI